MLLNVVLCLFQIPNWKDGHCWGIRHLNYPRKANKINQRSLTKAWHNHAYSHQYSSSNIAICVEYSKWFSQTSCQTPLRFGESWSYNITWYQSSIFMEGSFFYQFLWFDCLSVCAVKGEVLNMVYDPIKFSSSLPHLDQSCFPELNKSI